MMFTQEESLHLLMLAWQLMGELVSSSQLYEGVSQHIAQVLAHCKAKLLKVGAVQA